jgi:hypothetical protein
LLATKEKVIAAYTQHFILERSEQQGENGRRGGGNRYPTIVQLL